MFEGGHKEKYERVSGRIENFTRHLHQSPLDETVQSPKPLLSLQERIFLGGIFRASGALLMPAHDCVIGI